MPMNPKLLRPRLTGYVAPDADARAYISAVQTADGSKLEPAVAKAINHFVAGCKTDGIWSAVKASCILMGARTLSGALTPLVGTAPTNANFVSGDYNRKTGLLGNGSTKYLNTNRNNNTDPQDSKHMSVYITAMPSLAGVIMNASQGTTAGRSHIATGSTPGTDGAFRLNSNAASVTSIAMSVAPGFVGVSRSDSSNVLIRADAAETTQSQASSLLSTDEAIGVYARSTGAAPPAYTNARLAFYSIGESLTLSLLDTRVSALYTAIGAAIP